MLRRPSTSAAPSPFPYHAECIFTSATILLERLLTIELLLSLRLKVKACIYSDFNQDYSDETYSGSY